MGSGKDIDFCEIDIEYGFTYPGDDGKGQVKCKRARVLLRNELPDELTEIKGDLDLIGTPITHLPSRLTNIGGSLSLKGDAFTQLPEGLSNIGGDLYLIKTSTTHLHLKGTSIKVINKGVKVNGGG